MIIQTEYFWGKLIIDISLIHWILKQFVLQQFLVRTKLYQLNAFQCLFTDTLILVGLFQYSLFLIQNDIISY